MLLAEELALVALKADSGRHELGAGDQLNACLAGLLVAELMLEGAVGAGDREDRTVVLGVTASSPTLAAAVAVIAEKGPKLKAVLSHMSRGLQQHLGRSTWDAVVEGLERAGIVGPPAGAVRPRRVLLNAAARSDVVARLQAAAAGDGPMEPRTAVVLSMSGPGSLRSSLRPVPITGTPATGSTTRSTGRRWRPLASWCAN